MKLLHVVPTYLPAYRYGGPIVSIHALCRALVGLGHEVEVFTTNADGDGDLDVPVDRAVDVDGVQVSYFPWGTPRRLYRSAPLAAALRERVREFDFVHTHSLFLHPPVAAARAARLASVPYAVSPRGMLVRDLFRARGWLRKSAWLHLYGRRTLEAAAFLHATSELEAREAERFGFQLPPLEVVPNGVEPPEGRLNPDGIRPSLRSLAHGQPLVLYLGRLSWKKGLRPLVEAIAQVPRAQLVLAGPDDERLWSQLRRRAGELGCRERVAYVGEVRGDDKRFLLEQAELLVLPSHGENFGNVVLEALAHGTPVVTSPHVGAARLVEQWGVGRVVDPDPVSLAEALRLQLFLEPADRRRMADNARHLARSEYTWPAIAQALVERYASALRPRRAA
ncbi:MAG: glycosyltransferase [Planctomycetota bacterium]